MRTNTPTELIVHHTGGTDAEPLFDSSNQTFEIVNEAHRQNPNVNLGYTSSLGFFIGYHYFIDKTGKVTQGRLDTDEGAHTFGQNTSSIGICLAGNFDLTLPTPAQIEALRTLLVSKMKQYGIPATKIFPHRNFAQKTCYGRRLADDWARSLVTIQPDPRDAKIQEAKKLIQQAIDLLS